MLFDDFGACMAVLFEGAGRSLTDAQMETWFKCLGDLDVASLQTAILRWLSEVNSGFPNIAILRKFAIESEQGLMLPAEEAFITVKLAASKHDPYYEPGKFMAALPEIARKAVACLGGASWYAGLLIEDRSIWMSQFRRAYESISGRAETQRCLPEHLRPRLPGESTGPSRLGDSIRLLEPPDQKNAS